MSEKKLAIYLSVLYINGAYFLIILYMDKLDHFAERVDAIVGMAKKAGEKPGYDDARGLLYIYGNRVAGTIADKKEAALAEDTKGNTEQK